MKKIEMWKEIMSLAKKISFHNLKDSSYEDVRETLIDLRSQLREIKKRSKGK